MSNHQSVQRIKYYNEDIGLFTLLTAQLRVLRSFEAVMLFFIPVITKKKIFFFLYSNNYIILDLFLCIIVQIFHNHFT